MSRLPTITLSDEVLTQNVGGEAVLLDLASEQYFGLNAVGTRFWELLSEGLSMAEIISVMVQEFDVSLQQLEFDLGELLEQLSSAGLVVLGPIDNSTA